MNRSFRLPVIGMSLIVFFCYQSCKKANNFDMKSDLADLYEE